jgi:hypothetical protein
MAPGAPLSATAGVIRSIERAKSARRFAVLLASATALGACGRDDASRYLESDSYKNLLAAAQLECAAEGQPVVVSRPRLTGYLRSTSGEWQYYGYSDLIKELLGNRLTFLEFPIDEFMKHELQSGSAKHGETEYVRYSLTTRGAPECAAFDSAISVYPGLKQKELRRLGLPASMCIAAERVSEAKSIYEFREHRSEVGHKSGYARFLERRELIDRRDGSVVWSIRDNSFRDPGTRPAPGSFVCHGAAKLEALQKAAAEIEPNPLIVPIVKSVDITPTVSLGESRSVIVDGEPDGRDYPLFAHASRRDDYALREDVAIKTQGRSHIDGSNLHVLEGDTEFVTPLWVHLGCSDPVASRAVPKGVLVLAKQSPSRSCPRGFTQPFVLARVLDGGRKISVTPLEFSEPVVKGRGLTYRLLPSEGNDVKFMAVISAGHDERESPARAIHYRIENVAFAER